MDEGAPCSCPKTTALICGAPLDRISLRRPAPIVRLPGACQSGPYSHQHHDQLIRPDGEIEHVEHHMHRIQDQPAHHQVRHRDPEDVALLELLEDWQMKQRVVCVRANLAFQAFDLARQGWSVCSVVMSPQCRGPANGLGCA